MFLTSPHVIETRLTQIELNMTLSGTDPAETRPVKAQLYRTQREANRPS